MHIGDAYGMHDKTESLHGSGAPHAYYLFYLPENRWFDQGIAPIKIRNLKAVLFPELPHLLDLLKGDIAPSKTVLFKALFQGKQYRLGKTTVYGIRRRQAYIQREANRRGRFA